MNQHKTLDLTKRRYLPYRAGVRNEVKKQSFVRSIEIKDQ